MTKYEERQIKDQQKVDEFLKKAQLLALSQEGRVNYKEGKNGVVIVTVEKEGRRMVKKEHLTPECFRK